MILLAVLTALIAISALFFAVHRLADKSCEQEKKASTVAQLRQRVIHIEDQIANWHRYSENPDVSHELYQVALELLDRLSVLEPSQSFAATEQERLLALIDAPKQQQSGEGGVKVLASKAAIGKMRNELKDIKRILHQRFSNTLHRDDRYPALCQEIDTLATHITVDTYIALAAKAIDRQQSRRANQSLELAMQAIEGAASSDLHIHKDAKAIQQLLQQLAISETDNAQAKPATSECDSAAPVLSAPECPDHDNESTDPASVSAQPSR